MLGVTNPLVDDVRESIRRPLQLRFDSIESLPRRTLLTKRTVKSATPFDFTLAMQVLVRDIATRCSSFAHFDPTRILMTFTPSRNRSRYGLQARVTPLRLRNGSLTKRQRGVLYGVQRYFVDSHEMLYLMTFCLPRFLDQPFEDKLLTVVHEMYHISPQFDGDLRRLPGRCEWHSHSQKEYDQQMGQLLDGYLATEPDPARYEFLRSRTSELIAAHGGLSGVVVPRPKLIPLAW
jgi:predicted metallopeptidase